MTDDIIEDVKEAIEEHEKKVDEQTKAAKKIEDENKQAPEIECNDQI